MNPLCQVPKLGRAASGPRTPLAPSGVWIDPDLIVGVCCVAVIVAAAWLL